MKIRRLQIESHQLARLSIQMQMAGLSIKTPIRRINTVQQQRARMEINREYPRMKVDMESLRNNTGLKDIWTMTKEIAAQSFAHARQAVRNIENNGDYVAKPHHKGNPIAEIARRVMLRTKVPSTPGKAVDPTVDVKSDPGSLSINWSLHDVLITWDDYQTPIITVEPKPSIDITLAQKPHIEFKIVEYTYPPESGRNVDEAI
ncbi:MAG: hypothetical protein GX847_10270 [Clostridiales bacterium]|nr:hypothetical protein [Clostridiales bacterium]